MLNVPEFKKNPFMGILRGIDEDVLEPLIDAVISAGLKTIEITMNTPQAQHLIRNMRSIAQDKLVVGAGTVLTMDDLNLALDAGAMFIVLPVYQEQIVTYCQQNHIPVFPGALTPQEIFRAWEGGATMVKVFPAKFFGPSYFKEIKAPLQNIELLACGGVTPENINSFFANGASAIAFGASIFKKEWLLNRNFLQIEKSLKTLITAGLQSIS